MNLKGPVKSRPFQSAMPPGWNGLSRSARSFFGLTILLGASATLYSALHALSDPSPVWLLLAAATVLASLFTIQIPLPHTRHDGLYITLGDIFLFTTMLFCGPEEASIVALVEGLTILTRVGRKKWALARVKEPYKKLFNLAQLSLSAFLAGHLFYLLDGQGAPLRPEVVSDPLRLFLLAAASGFAYFLINTWLVAAALAFSSGTPTLRIWRGNLVWAWVTHLTGSTLGCLIFLGAGHRSSVVLMAIPMGLLIYLAYKTNRDRIVAAQSHAEEVEYLLGQKIEAEQELQQAKEELEIRVRRRTRELSQANLRLQGEVADRRRAEERLAATLRSIGDGVIASRLDGSVLFVNKAAEKLTGWGYNEAVGRALKEVFPCSDGVAPDGSCPPSFQDSRLRARDGNERLVSQSWAPIQDRKGQTHGWVVAFRDVSYQRKMEEELLKAQKLESLGVLAGGIAHDFNNLLGGILLKTQLALMGLAKGGSPVAELEQVEEATRRASDLTKQLITFARGGAPVKQSASIGELIEENARFVLHGAQVDLDVEIPDNLWPVEVDRGQISQVIQNLVINADQAMPQGGTLTIRACNVAQVSGLSEGNGAGGCVEITVEDTGEGIEPADLEKVFDPYFSTKQGGCGLGLASTYSIVSRHGGRIEVSSRCGIGTCFTILLPAAKNPREEPKSETGDRTPAERGPDSPSRAQRPGASRLPISAGSPHSGLM